MVYAIQKLGVDVKGVISQYKLDKNKDGKIDDKELPAVLAHGVKERKGNVGTGIAIGIPLGFFTTIAAGGFLDMLGEIFTGGMTQLSPDHPMYDKAPFQNSMTGHWIERNYKHPKMVKIGKFLNGTSKRGGGITLGISILAGLAAAGYCIYEAANDKSLYLPPKQSPKQQKNPVPVDSLEQKFSDGFKQLGVDSELKKYTPKRGENWSKILKAKYGTDEVTAVRMAHRIKDVIYDDSLASKQTPVMYLPQNWKFDGKVYNYNDSAQVQTGKLGGNVKTEMGKMNPQIKYN